MKYRPSFFGLKENDRRAVATCFSFVCLFSRFSYINSVPPCNSYVSYLLNMFLILHLNRSHPRSVSASSHRPFSAKHTMTPSPPGSERSASARIRPASARPRPASARPRPASARITYSSHKDYLVNTACRDIPRSPSQSSVSRKVGETKTSQLRLGLRKKTADSWMLEESRQYLGRKSEDFKQPKRNDLLLLFKPIRNYHWKCSEFHTIIYKYTQMVVT